ncbi:hypothetical protein PV325_004663 [Microctonus aethiopoides]|uniref:Small RNA 2'-O-methyltransferase n=1 Tax=Microctonus aethiopoides TaxID=144406 RepID=A0AA39C8T6_9HYME|nr:hypothetical protein PV325_004663 [Microctonus aethiopoides]KAK0160029.1 hypothetical protein PV328_007475 [Microctonus aethiopoides]
MIIVFFHMLFFVVKYFSNKLNVSNIESDELRDEPASLRETTSYCAASKNTIKSIVTNSEIEDQFYDDCNNKKETMKFRPPAYIQRYHAVINELRAEKYRGKIKKVVDFGCSELGFFNHLKNTPGIEEIICVDIDTEVLEKNKKRIEPLTADYLHVKDHPLNVYIYEGSVTHPDKHLENADAIIGIELIEHLYSDTLNDLPQNIFRYIKPKLAIFTTPNVEFNVLFPNLNGFRHDDHKFEWTRNEFTHWASEIINKYPDYKVRFKGICRGPKGTEKYGCCSQMAIFHRREDIDTQQTATISGVNNLFKLVSHVEYPFRIDNRSPEVKIMDEASYFIRRYQLNNDCDDETMPFDYLLRIMDNLTITTDEFREILSKAGWHVVNDEQRGLLINLKPLSILSSSAPDDSDTPLEDIEEIHSQIDANTINNGELNEKIINDDDEKLINNSASDSNNCGGFNRSIEFIRSNDDDGIERSEAHHDLESICSINLESPLNENSLLCPQNITDPNFQCSIVDEDLSVGLINNYAASDVSFRSDDEDSNPKLTSTPNKNKKKRMRELSRENIRDFQFDDQNYFIDKIDGKTIKKINYDGNYAGQIHNKDTPSSSSCSPEIIPDSGYPHSSSAPDWSPGYDIPSLGGDIEVELPKVDIYDCLVENGDLANNNRDNEGNNMIAPVENDDFDDLQPVIDVLENDLENENGIYDIQNGFPVWLLRIHAARLL